MFIFNYFYCCKTMKSRRGFYWCFFFKKNYFYQWFHRREVSLLVKSRSMDKLRSIFFFSGVKIAGIVIIPLVSGHQIGPLTCGSYRDGSQTLPLYFIVRWGVNYTSIARVFLQYFSYSWFYNSSSKLFWSLLVFVLRYILLKKIFLYNLMCWY